jgi:hypothetical protein
VRQVKAGVLRAYHATQIPQSTWGCLHQPFVALGYDMFSELAAQSAVAREELASPYSVKIFPTEEGEARFLLNTFNSNSPQIEIVVLLPAPTKQPHENISCDVDDPRYVDEFKAQVMHMSKPRVCD